MHPPGSLGWLKALTAEMAGSAVTSVSAPGGRGRRSVRVELEDGRTLIATQRETAERGRNEAGLLGTLAAQGAPVPHVIGFRDGLMLQADAGRNRLSNALVRADIRGRVDLLRRAIAALDACRAAMTQRPDVLAQLPGLGTHTGWIENFVARAVFLSGDLRIGPPPMDVDAVTRALSAPPDRFTRWDARTGNAVVQADGRIIWYDWNVFGRRGGVEDVSFLLADLYADVPVADWMDLLAEAVPDAPARDLVRRMAIFVAVDRLRLIHGTVLAKGWADPRDTQRHDLVGAVPDLVEGLCSRMAGLAEDDPLLDGFTDWFTAASRALTEA
ncbi:MAG: hypothetical protein AAFY65_12510 [Pseudomonadota bacterium]